MTRSRLKKDSSKQVGGKLYLFLYDKFIKINPTKPNQPTNDHIRVTNKML